MSQLPQPFQDIAWYRATRLTERLDLLRARPGVEYNSAISHCRMRLWRSQSPFQSNAGFAYRLRADGATEHEFRRALGIPTEAFGVGGVPPEWLRALSEAFQRPPDPRRGTTASRNVQGRCARRLPQRRGPADHQRAGPPSRGDSDASPKRSRFAPLHPTRLKRLSSAVSQERSCGW